MRRQQTLTVTLIGFFLTTSLLLAQPAEKDRAYLGVIVDLEQAEARVVVGQVSAGSPAAKSGLKPGDQITKVNGKDVKTAAEFAQVLGSHKAGDKLVLVVVRAGQEMEQAVLLTERPQPGAATPAADPARPRLPVAPLLGPQAKRRAFLGLQTQDVTLGLKERLNLTADRGLLVTEVVADSPAAKAGVKNEDVITEMGGKAVNTLEELRQVIKETGIGKDLPLSITRGKEKLELKATLVEAPPDAAASRNARLDRLQNLDLLQMFDGGQRVQELEQRVQELERRLRELEKRLEKK